MENNYLRKLCFVIEHNFLRKLCIVERNIWGTFERDNMLVAFPLCVSNDLRETFETNRLHFAMLDKFPFHEG